jgi:putative transposase
LIHPHSEYVGLGQDPVERQVAYRALFKTALSDDQLLDIRAHLQQQRALGTSRFQDAIEAELGRVAKVRARGRPRKVF